MIFTKIPFSEPASRPILSRVDNFQRKRQMRLRKKEDVSKCSLVHPIKDMDGVSPSKDNFFSYFDIPIVCTHNLAWSLTKGVGQSSAEARRVPKKSGGRL